MSENKTKPTKTPPTLTAPTVNYSTQGQTLVHYVNIATPDAKWVDGDLLKSIDAQTRRPKIKVDFNKKGVFPFKVKLVTGKSNSQYSSTEKSRNSNYTYTTSQKSYTTKPDGTLIVNDFELAVGGTDLYTFEVSDEKDNILLTQSLQTRRRVYLQEIKMRGEVEKNAASNLDIFLNEFSQHGIDITRKKTPTVLMKSLENIGSDTTQFMAETKKAYTSSHAPKYEPYAVVVAYTGHLAVKKNDFLKLFISSTTIGSKQKTVTAKVQDKAGKVFYLWNKIVTGEDWLISAEFVPDDPKLPIIPIPRSAISAIDEYPNFAPGRSKAVLVKVSDLSPIQQTGRVILKVAVVDRFRGGLSFSGGNLICVCTRAWWSTIGTDEQNRTMIHEMGHKISLVPGGKAQPSHDESKLDQGKYFYETSQGHVGNHCHNGIADKKAPLRYDSQADAATSTCVMYGQITDNSAFCPECATAAKKTDLSNGWKAF